MTTTLFTEKTLFNYLKENFIEDLFDLNTINSYNSIDCYSEKYRTRIELKSRKAYYTSLLIEKEKYNELMKFKHCRYINSYPCNGDNKIISFDLHKIEEPTWSYKLLPAKTETNWKPTLVLKEIGYLKLEQGTIIK